VEGYFAWAARLFRPRLQTRFGLWWLEEEEGLLFDFKTTFKVGCNSKLKSLTYNHHMIVFIKGFLNLRKSNYGLCFSGFTNIHNEVLYFNNFWKKYKVNYSLGSKLYHFSFVLNQEFSNFGQVCTKILASASHTSIA